MTPSLTRSASYFNPRPPWGGRLRREQLPHGNLYISIHALRGEGDVVPSVHFCAAVHFNPRPPWGGRPAAVEIMVALIHISIHALRGEGDFVRVYKGARLRLFQSTPSVGRAT